MFEIVDFPRGEGWVIFEKFPNSRKLIDFHFRIYCILYLTIGQWRTENIEQVGNKFSHFQSSVHSFSFVDFVFEFSFSFLFYLIFSEKPLKKLRQSSEVRHNQWNENIRVATRVADDSATDKSRINFILNSQSSQLCINHFAGGKKSLRRRSKLL